MLVWDNFICKELLLKVSYDKLQLQCYALSLLNYASAEVYKFVNLIYLYTIGGGYTGGWDATKCGKNL